MFVIAKNLPTYAIFVAINFGCSVHLSKGMENCEYEECLFTGYTCKNNKCVCDPDEPDFRCIPPKSHGELCNSDPECQLSDYNLHCVKSDPRICKCKRSYIWDSERKKCLPTLDDDIYKGRFDPVRDLVIPAIIIVTIGAMVGKLWRRRRHQEITRELEEISATPHQQATWIASYRVFSPYNNTSRPPPGLSPTSFPFHPTPCMGLFVPSQLSTSPPSYEEALKHKVILSSYHPTGPPPGPLPAYTLPPPDVSRQYQTLPANSSSSSSAFILNPSGPNASAIRISTMSGHRSLPLPQTENYAGLPTSHYPICTQHLYSGKPFRGTDLRTPPIRKCHRRGCRPDLESAPSVDVTANEPRSASSRGRGHSGGVVATFQGNRTVVAAAAAAATAPERAARRAASAAAHHHSANRGSDEDQHVPADAAGEDLPEQCIRTRQDGPQRRRDKPLMNRASLRRDSNPGGTVVTANERTRAL
ncbi:UNVERIFIED_CONTAM: hypothetical protein PYX00_001419 [Menopon gallinae]|uniref:Uncharacterized protein n=1 Tax=Menopon gallinae TaxID=328185 RepID=A0AAW2IDV7_9NEOP